MFVFVVSFSDQYEKLKMLHEQLEADTVSKKDQDIKLLSDQQEVLTNNLISAQNENGQLQSMIQGYKTQTQRLQEQFQQCQTQLQVGRVTLHVHFILY